MFASRIKCGECSSWYGSKVWHSTDKYRRVIYQCNHKFKGDRKCATPHIDEEAIKQLFVSAANALLADKGEIIANFNLVKDDLFDTAALEAEWSELQGEMAVTAEIIQKCIGENARVTLDQTEYQERYSALVKRFDTAKARFEEVDGQVSDRQSRRNAMEAFIAELGSRDALLDGFDERLWVSLVDFATVFSENNVRFTFKDGTEIKV
jgi:hypothetical protein